MHLVRMTVALAALLWLMMLPMAYAVDEIKLRSPSTGQEAVMSLEPCRIPEAKDAPVVLYHIQIKPKGGEAFDGCWTPMPGTPGAMVIFTPEGKPEPADDLGEESEREPAKKGSYRL